MDSGTTNLRVSEEVFDAILDRLKKFDKVRLFDVFLLEGSTKQVFLLNGELLLNSFHVT